MTRFLLTFSMALLGMLTASSCLKDRCVSDLVYLRFDPVYVHPSDFRTGIRFTPSRELKNPGKLYVLGNYLFINEREKGIHVFDNSDPARPQPLGFWEITGNVDMAIRGSVLYADQYTDLLTIDISQWTSPVLLCRKENVFQLHGNDPERGVIVRYDATEEKVRLSCDDAQWGRGWFMEGDVMFVESGMVGFSDASATGGSGSQAFPAGIAGSYARFGLFGDYLYTVDQSSLGVWSVGQGCAELQNTQHVGWNIETIFPWKNYLFIGSQTGVFIFDNTNPENPMLTRRFDHASGCDPVVCDDRYAYVTLHSGATCNGVLNQLEVIDIANLPHASLLKIYPMKRPKGLAVSGNELYLCDDGLKIFDKTNPMDLRQLAHLRQIDAYDCIVLSASHLLVIGADGFYQYDVSVPASPRLLGSIPVQR